MTLPEVVIACLILGITLSGFVMTFASSQKMVALTNNRVVAMHEARRQIENLMCLKYADPALSVGNHTISNGSYLVSENAGTKNVAMTINWSDPAQPGTSTVTLVTSMSYAIHR